MQGEAEEGGGPVGVGLKLGGGGRERVVRGGDGDEEKDNKVGWYVG